MMLSVGYASYAIYIYFGFIFMVLLGEGKFSKKLTFTVSSIVLSLLIAGNYLIYIMTDDRIFYFFFPLTSIVTELMLILYTSRYDGLKVLFNLLSSLLFCTIVDLIIDINYLIFDLEYRSIVLLQLFLLTSFAVISYFFIRPLFMLTARYLEKGWGIACVALFTYAIMIFIMKTVMADDEQISFRFGLTFIMIIFYISICLFSGYTMRRQEAKHSAKLLQAQVKAVANQSATFLQNEKKLSLLRHDMRHQVVIVSELIKQGHLDEAMQALNGIEEKLEASKTKIYCSNIFVNAAVSVYVAKANAVGINTVISLDVPTDISIDSSELSVAIANALENAVNACMEIEDTENRKIVVTARTTDKNLIFEVANTYTGDIVFGDEGIPQAQEQNHGIGSQSISTFVKNYNALLDYECTDGWFKIRILVNT